jgi:hypothetical protein
MDSWRTAVEEGYRQGFADAGKIGIVVVVIIIVAVMGLR